MAVDYIDIRPLQPRRQQTLVIAKAVFSVLTDDWQSVSQITKLLNHVKASRMEVAGVLIGMQRRREIDWKVTRIAGKCELQNLYRRKVGGSLFVDYTP